MMEGNAGLGEYILYGIVTGLIVAVVLSLLTWIVVRAARRFSMSMAEMASKSALIIGVLSFCIVFFLWLLMYILVQR